MSTQDETIFALATPAGRSGVAILRVSGPDCLHSLKGLLPDVRVYEAITSAPRYAVLADLRHEARLIDRALVLYFKAPGSFTGEEVVEYHLHGSPAVIEEMMAYLSGCTSHRPAERGEFTRRGFENGQMDLTEAESIIDLIHAETAAQKDLALAQMSGSLRDLYEGWAEELTKSLAYLEADLDFPDEDLPDGVTSQVLPKIKDIYSDITYHLDDNRRGERLRDGLKVAVIGAPNAGKSTLVNMLAQRDIAITSDFAGTTRDVLEVHLNIGGYPVILQDTAGLKPELLSASATRTGQDAIESEGIRRALDVARHADLKLLVFDAVDAPATATLELIDARSLVVLNKMDLVQQACVRANYPDNALHVSLKDAVGIDELLEALNTHLKDLIGVQDMPMITRERHRHHLTQCISYLQRALSDGEKGQSVRLPELIAEDVRLAVRALGRITGRVDVEDLLDLIFSEFCIGK